MPEQQDGSSGAAELAVPSAPRNVGVLRRFAVDACVALGLAELTDTVALLVTEAATNALLHAYGPEIRLRVIDRGAWLRIEVHDASPVLPVPRRAPAAAEDGRGMALVEALADRWGADPRPDGKTLWFEVSAPAAR